MFIHFALETFIHTYIKHLCGEGLGDTEDISWT